MTDHTLADEIGRYAIDAGRVQFLVYSIAVELSKLHGRGLVHPSLHPANIRVADDTVQLLGMHEPASKSPPYAATETIARGELTPGSNFYTLAIILRELVAGRTKLLPKAAALVTTCADPKRRPKNANEMIDAISKLGWTVEETPPWRKPYTARDAKEAELLAALQRDVRDQDLKNVYADWLEGNGFAERANFLRTGHTKTDADVTWRALFVDAKLVCNEPACPGTWDKLTPSALDNQRHCQACSQDVHYCASYIEGTGQAKRSERVAVDPALVFDRIRALMPVVAPRPGWQPVPPMNPPPPMPPPNPTLPPVFEAPPTVDPPAPPVPQPTAKWWEFWKK